MKSWQRFLIFQWVVFFIPWFSSSSYSLNHFSAAMSPLKSQGFDIKERIYFGVMGGLDINSLKKSGQLQAPAGSFSFDATSQTLGVTGGVFLGYRIFMKNHPNISTALELYLNGTSNNPEEEIKINDNEIYNNSINFESVYAISLLPGFKINKSSLGYLRLGYQWVKAAITEIHMLGDFTPYKDTQYTTLGGKLIGVGIETFIHTNIGLRLEYDFSQENTVTTSLNTKVRPMNFRTLLGITYFF